MNRRHTSVTSSKPGSQTPGGIGCDIKHNSYDRYLNRLKGKGPLRRGKIPATFGQPIPFNPAFPIYGGKTTKTNLVSGCNCSQEEYPKNYDYPPYPVASYNFNVGDYVYAKQNGNNFYTRAIIINENNDIYTIEFDNGTIQETNVNELLVYFPCNCGITIDDNYYTSGVIGTIALNETLCTLSVNELTNGQVL
jgi:hypothetical protein